MSVLGIASSSLFSYLAQNTQNKGQQFKQEFQQLCQDLQSGNLSAAQSDLTTLQQSMPQAGSASQSSSPIAQALSKLSQDLQSGNLSVAQSDYSTVQQDFQSQGAQAQSASGHHHHHSGSSGSSSANAMEQLFNELGSALQSGNLTNAQQAYSSLQQDLLQFTGTSATSSAATPTSATSVTA